MSDTGLFPIDDSEHRHAVGRPYSQPRHPRWQGRPITRLERKVIESGLFQHEIAKGAGLTQAHLSQIIHGRRQPTARQLLRLAEFFKCSPKELVGYESG